MKRYRWIEVVALVAMFCGFLFVPKIETEDEPPYESQIEQPINLIIVDATDTEEVGACESVEEEPPEPVEEPITWDDTFLSEEIQAYCEKAGAMYAVSPELIEAIIETESSGRIHAQNGSCYGLMQVDVNLHTERANRLGVDLHTAWGNILVGTDLLAELFDRYNDEPLVLMKYNGVRKAQELYERGEYNYYTKKVMERAYQLERCHNKC